MALVTIDGQPYAAYADLAAADLYLGGSISSGAIAWRSETDDDVKGRALVEGYRLINRQSWAGEKLDDAQEGSFPRSGLEGVDDYEIPQAVIDANIELAAAFLAGETDVLNNPSTVNGVRRYKAGSVELEYFFPSAEAASRFPLIIQELLGQFLVGATATGVGGPSACGTGGYSSFSRGYGLNRPL